MGLECVIERKLIVLKLRRVTEISRGWMTKETAALFGAALAVRIMVSLIQISYGEQRIPGLPPNNWSDFYGVYAQWLGFVHKGLLPYRDIISYKITPLFLYSLYPFYVAAGAHAAAIPIVVSDAATAVLVYLIAKRAAGNKIAFAAGLIYSLSPLVLYEIYYLWLSSQPMTFFMLLAVYLLKENRPILSIAFLAVAVMFKQEALFILPAYLLLYAKEYRKEIPKGLVLFLAIFVTVSLPFLIIAPKDYIYGINYFPNVINLGPREPSPLAASQIFNAPPSNPIPVVVQGPVWASYLGILGRMGSVLSPLLLVLLVPALYAIRRSPHFLEMLCTYSLIAFLAAYSVLVGSTLAYYFVPAYALIFASIVNLRTLGLGVAAALLSVAIPEGSIQAILPLVCLLLMTALQDPLQSSRAKGTTSLPTVQAKTSEPRTPQNRV
jgi:4-amino-4-deoxy-L-arabinose transferase-like glycosyltransferase